MSQLPALWIALVLLPAPATAQAPNVVTKELTITGTVDRIQKPERFITLRSADNVFQMVYVAPSITAFDSLKVGDAVTMRYQASVVVTVRRNAKLSTARDTTAVAQKADPTVMEQTTAVVKVESVDLSVPSITYRTADDRKMMQAVTDKKLLDGLHSGDLIEVTLTRARALSIEPAR